MAESRPVAFDDIREHLEASQAVVALLTPQSISRPWLLFESGYGAANRERDVIPVCVGIDSLRDIPFPLAMYQCYQLADYESLKSFVERVLSKYGIVYDEELAKPLLRKAISEITKALGPFVIESPPPESTLSDVAADLKDHVVKRFYELRQFQNQPVEGSTESEQVAVSHSVQFIIRFPELPTRNTLTFTSILTSRTFSTMSTTCSLHTCNHLATCRPGLCGKRDRNGF